ncbi:hypothetical protein [Serinicoccus chungangensis]|uniref:hypothetical protein n=1 Tax=Serinicoccus chungangensis TaxID=767452 RepID=UPI00130524E0|nr:hypothetical protein [Serinicoccus chungangensis]
MVPEFPGWIVVVLWVLLGIAGLAIVWASTKSTLRGMDVVLPPPENEHGRPGEAHLQGEEPLIGDGDSVENDHDRGAPER